MTLFDRSALYGRSVGDIVFGPLDNTGTKLKVIDVGARNGMGMLPEAITKRAHMIGFEPNEDEHRKLLNHSTDADLAGIRPHKFKSEEYIHAAVWSVNGEQDLFVKETVAASTLMGEPDETYSGNIYPVLPGILPNDGATIAETIGKTVKRLRIDCRTLDEVIDVNETVDLMKLDVEGGELNVLEGAQTLIRNKKPLFIFSEFFVLPVYPDVPLLCDQYTFLRDRGYRLVDLDRNHPDYYRTHCDVPRLNDRPLFLAGDAIFVLDPDINTLSSEERQRMGVIALALGFTSFALSLFYEARMCTSEELRSVEAALAKVPLRRRLKSVWLGFPQKIANLLERMRA